MNISHFYNIHIYTTNCILKFSNKNNQKICMYVVDDFKAFGHLTTHDLNFYPLYYYRNLMVLKILCTFLRHIATYPCLNLNHNKFFNIFYDVPLI